MAIEDELKKLAIEVDADIEIKEGVWSEWSPVPFGRVPAPANDEPLSFSQKVYALKSASQP